jgi:hypothetical protein
MLFWRSGKGGGIYYWMRPTEVKQDELLALGYLLIGGEVTQASFEGIFVAAPRGRCQFTDRFITPLFHARN